MAPRGMTGLRVNTYFERQNSNDFTVPNTVGDKHNTFLDSVCNTLSNKNYLKINNGLKIRILTSTKFDRVIMCKFVDRKSTLIKM